MPETLLIANCALLADTSGILVGNAFIEIAGTTVRSIGTMDNAPPAPAPDVIDARGMLAMPGLINGHNHAAMTLFRGLADDLELMTWLNEHIFPAEAARVDPEMVYLCSKLAAAEMLLSGTTTVADAYFHAGMAALAFRDAGLRAVASHGVIDFPAPGVPDPAENVAAVERFLDDWTDRDPLITPAVFAHSPYTCSPATLRSAKDLADKRQVPFFLHLAESSRETAMLIDPRGESPVRHLQALGLLDRNTVCVHSVWLDETDLDILAAAGARVVTCPQSNLKLASGTAPVPEMLARGIPVGLGTDGCASNNSLDMFREMDMLAKIQKLRTGDATALSARQALGCATAMGAAALDMPLLGRIAVGHPADLILIDPAAPHLTPFYNQDLLVYAACGRDVRTVVVNGRIVVRDRTLVNFDLDELLEKVSKLAASLQSL